MKTIPGVDAHALRGLLHSPDPIASVYFDLRPTGEQDVPLRWRPIIDRLAAQGAGPATLDVLTEHVSDSVPGPGVLAAFGAAEDVVLAVDMPGSEQPDSAVYAALPHLAPLLAWLQDRPPHVAAVVDRIDADITVYPSGTTGPISTVVTGPDDEIERNAPGGPAQLRYQHRAEDSWEHNAARVADALSRTLRRFAAHVLVLAGDTRALQYLDDHLPAWTRHEVMIRRIGGGRSQDGSGTRRPRRADVAADGDGRRPRRKWTRGGGRTGDGGRPCGGTSAHPPAGTGCRREAHGVVRTWPDGCGHPTPAVDRSRGFPHEGPARRCHRTGRDPHRSRGANPRGGPAQHAGGRDRSALSLRRAMRTPTCPTRW